MAKTIRERVPFFALVMVLASMLWAQGNAPSKATAGNAPATAKRTAPASHSPGTKLQAAVCNIDVANKTIRVVPWDGKTWKRDSSKVLTWNDQTRLVSGAHTLTMPQFIGGRPLSDDKKDVSSILGERGIFYFTTIDGKEIIRRVEFYIVFGGESFAGMVGSRGAQIVGGTKVSCGDDTSSRGQEPLTTHLGEVTVITTDSAMHMLQNVELSDQNDLDLSSWGFSRTEIQSVVVLTDAEEPREEQLFIRREILESRKQTYHALILPLSAIDRITATGTTIRSPEREDVLLDYGIRYYSEVSATMRDGEVLRAVTSQNLKHNFARSGAHEFLVTGTEDLHEFGKAVFTNGLGDGDIKEIRFPSLPPAVITTKSALAAVITEVGGRTTRLSDLRIGGGTALTFTRTGSTVQLIPSDIRRIELHQGIYDGNTNAIAPNRIAASVLLNNGAQQDFEWKTAALVGKTTGGWYEWIPGAAIKTIEFATVSK